MSRKAKASSSSSTKPNLLAPKKPNLPCWSRVRIRGILKPQGLGRSAALSALLVVSAFGVGCAHSRAAAPAVAPKAPVASDASSELIASADALLASGLEQARAGHLNKAR